MIITGDIINGRCRYAPEEKLQLESLVIQKREENKRCDI